MVDLLSALNGTAIDPRWCTAYKGRDLESHGAVHRATSERRARALAESMELILHRAWLAAIREAKAGFLTTRLTLCHFVITPSQIGKETSSGS